MGTEIEAKFFVPDRAAFERARTLSHLATYSLGEGRLSSVRDDYLDTDDRVLLAAGYACRLREQEDRILLTVKSVAGSHGAIHRREELEAALPAEVSLAARPPFTVSDWPSFPARDKIAELAGDRNLLVLFSLNQERFLRDVMEANRRVAVASLDRVSLVVGSASRQWSELEIELAFDGTETDLAAMSDWVRDALGLKPATGSKFERALQVVNAGRRNGPPLSAGRRATSSVVMDAPADGPSDLPVDVLAGMGYTARLRRKTEDRLTFFDTHDGAYMKRGYSLSWSEVSRRVAAAGRRGGGGRGGRRAGRRSPGRSHWIGSRNDSR